MPIIKRSNVVIGAKQDSYYVGGRSGKYEHYEEVISGAQILALHSAPVELLPALGPARAYMVAGIHAHKFLGAWGGGADLTVNYKDSSNTEIARLPLAQMTSAGADERWATSSHPSGSILTVDFPAGVGVDLNVGAAITGSGGDLYLAVLYTIIEA